MNWQLIWTFLEAFFTVVAAAGSAGLGLIGPTFPGWWTVMVALVPTVILATLAGVRRVQSLYTTPKP